MTKTTINKNKVSAILTGLGEIADRPQDEKGNLNVKAFNELPEVKKTVKRLKELGVNRKWLRDNGFQVALMVLNI